MIQFRSCVFETNSSITHSIVMCLSAGYDKWTENEALFNEYLRPQFVSLEDGRKYNAEILRKWYDATIVRKDENDKDFLYFDDDEDILENFTLENIEKYEKGEFNFNEFYLDKYDVAEKLYYDYDYWYENVCEYYETFVDEFTTPSGEKVTAFGYYGHD